MSFVTVILERLRSPCVLCHVHGLAWLSFSQHSSNILLILGRRGPKIGFNVKLGLCDEPFTGTMVSGRGEVQPPSVEIVNCRVVASFVDQSNLDGRAPPGK